jgi:hypothetical protein
MKMNNAKDFGVVKQVRMAFKGRNQLPTALGFLLAGFVPLAIWYISHYEACRFTELTFSKSGPWALVFGGLAYSAQTVFQWAKLAFMSVSKSLGYVVLLEGVLVGSSTLWLQLSALMFLICINGIATGCRLTVGAK